MRLLAAAAPAFLCVAITGGAWAAQPLAPMAAHRALYDLTLDTAHSGDVVGAHGNMSYEVIDACDGWAVRQKLAMTITNANGQDIEMVSDYATWESKDGTKLRFHMKQTTDTAMTSQTDGDADLERLGGPGKARYTLPRETTVDLPAGTLFPMVHTETLIKGASEGKKVLSLPLFDGTDESGAEDSSVVVLDWKPPFKTEWPDLNSLRSTRVRLAFFDRHANTATPNYEVGMRYWENGVADDMSMDFGDFTMSAKMKEFQLVPHRC